MINSVPIRVSRNTRDKLKAIGSKGETYDDIINKMLEYPKKDFTWIFSKPQKEIIKKLYKRHRKNSLSLVPSFYYAASLSKALDTTRQAIFKPLRVLIDRGIVTVVKTGAGPDKGQVDYLGLSDDGIAIWNFLMGKRKRRK